MKYNIISTLLGLALASSLHAGFTVYPEYHYQFSFIASNAMYTDLEPTGINNNNQTVGIALQPGVGAPVVFINYGGNSYLYSPFHPHPDGRGMGINDSGTIIGAGETNSGEHAFYLPLHQSAIDLDSVASDDSSGFAINNNGYFVGELNGQAAFGSTTEHWMIQVDGTLGKNFFASALNDNFTVVGTGPSGGAIWDVATNTVTQLSTKLGTTQNTARVVNQDGVVAGTVGDLGYLYENGTFTFFGPNITSVDGINSSKNVVGMLQNGHGFLYTASTHTITDVNTLMPSTLASQYTLISASGINDHNSICGLAKRNGTSEIYKGFTLIYTAGAIGLVPPSGLGNLLK